MSDLAHVLSTWRTDATVMRRLGDSRLADTIERVCQHVEESAQDWLVWLSESDALLRSGRSVDYFRNRRIQWMQDGHAKKIGRTWYYRRVIVPRSTVGGIA